MPSTTTINASDGKLWIHFRSVPNYMEIPTIIFLFFAFLVVFEMSNLLGTGLDRDTLNICAQLLEEGANPEALAALVIELNKESSRN